MSVLPDIIIFLGSIVFLDPSQPGSIDDSTSYYGNHQIAHLSKPWGVVEKAQYSNTSKARQDARVHIFTAALLEHICSLYEPRPERRQRVLQGITKAWPYLMSELMIS